MSEEEANTEENHQYDAPSRSAREGGQAGAGGNARRIGSKLSSQGGGEGGASRNLKDIISAQHHRVSSKTRSFCSTALGPIAGKNVIVSKKRWSRERYHYKTFLSYRGGGPTHRGLRSPRWRRGRRRRVKGLSSGSESPTRRVPVKKGLLSSLKRRSTLRAAGKKGLMSDIS